MKIVQAKTAARTDPMRTRDQSKSTVNPLPFRSAIRHLHVRTESHYLL
jgi:hypothetical protein